MGGNMENKILFNVNPNKDKYTWKQLSCTYRPWQTVLQVLGDKYVDAFLLCISYYAIYVDKCVYKIITDFIEPYNKYFSIDLGISIDSLPCNDFKSFDSAISKIIDSNSPVLIPVDLMYLHYNPMYLLEHRYKCMVIKGYDDKRGLYYILDNIHIDYGASTKLTDFVIKKEELFSMFNSACNELHIISQLYYWQKKSDIDLNGYTVLQLLSRIIKKTCSDVGVSRLEEQMLSLDWDKDKEFIVEIEKNLDFRYVFFDKLNLYLSRIKECKQRDIAITSMILNKIYDDTDSLRRASLQTKYLPLNEYNKLKAEQLELLGILAESLSSLNENDFVEDDSVISGFENCTIVNNLSAPIYFSEENIVIQHEKANKYDTWIMQDNAVQILYPVSCNGFIQARFSMVTGIGEDTHTGIILHDTNGTTYLFGIVRGEFIALYCPQLENDYNIFEHHNFKENSDNVNKFRVEVRCGEVTFYYCDVQSDEMISCCTLKINIKDIGLFSKTWENIAHKVTIDNITCVFEQ